MVHFTVDYDDPSQGWLSIELPHEAVGNHTNVKCRDLVKVGSNYAHYYKGLVMVIMGEILPDGSLNRESPPRIVLPLELRNTGPEYRSAVLELLSPEVYADIENDRLSAGYEDSVYAEIVQRLYADCKPRLQTV